MIRVLRSAVLYIAVALGANAAAAQDLGDYLTGQMRGLVIHDAPVAASSLPFVRADETEGALADYSGRYVVLNFWATWCAPCREEMPSLQNLQTQLGGDEFAVVTLATGRNPPQAIRRFFEEIGVETLPQYRDINQQIAREMGVFGLPITVILNPEGQEIARLRGDAYWDSPEAIALIEALLADGDLERELADAPSVTRERAELEALELRVEGLLELARGLGIETRTLVDAQDGAPEIEAAGATAPDLPLLDEERRTAALSAPEQAVVAALPEPAPVVATVHPPPRPASAELTALPQIGQAVVEAFADPQTTGAVAPRIRPPPRPDDLRTAWAAPPSQPAEPARPTEVAVPRAVMPSMSADPVAGREAARVLPTRPTKPPLALPFGLRP